MNTNDFDVILDASDADFADDLTKALGLNPGEKINLITPQFERTDGRVVMYRPTTPEEYSALKEMSSDSLKKIGCQVWDKEGGKTHWLYPHEWYNHIPNGTEVVDICKKVEKFEAGKTDDDIRFGALSYGFIQRQH